MKVLNIVLSILILLLAVASAAFSYMLFEKRTQMLDGYEKMGSQIVNAAKALDANSGTSVSKELGGDALSYKSESLDSALSKMTKLARDVSAERDTLADALAGIDKTAGGKTTVEELSSLESYDDAAAKVKSQVDALNLNRSKIVSALQVCANDFDIQLNVENLRASGSTFENEMRAFTAELSNFKKYKEQQEMEMKKVAASLGVDNLTFSPVRYKEDLNKYSKAIADLKAAKVELEKSKNDLSAKLESADKSVANQSIEIAALKKQIADRERDLKVLSASIKGERFMDEITVWQPGSVEARKAAQGKVLDVNKKFGFITIDIGANSNVQQLISSESAPIAVNPMIAVDDVMLVSPELNAADAQCAGKLKIFKVEGNCAFANVMETTDLPIKVGDVVIFDTESANN